MGQPIPSDDELNTASDDLVWKAIVLIQLNRIYDMLCLVATNTGGSKKVDELIEFHKNGGTYAPPPARQEEE